MDPSDQERGVAADYAMGIATETHDPDNPLHDALTHGNVTEAGNVLQVTEHNAVNMHGIHVAPLDTVAYQDVYYEEVLTTSPAMGVHVQMEDHSIHTEYNEDEMIQAEDSMIQGSTIPAEGNAIPAEDHSIQADGSTVPVEGSTILAEDHSMQAEDSTMQAEDHLVQAEDSTMQAEDHLIHAEDSTMQAADHLIQAEDSTMQAEDHLIQAEDSTIQAEDHLIQAEDSTIQAEDHLIQAEGSNTMPAEDGTMPAEDHSLQAEDNEDRAIQAVISALENKRKMSPSPDGEPTVKRKKARKKKGALSTLGGVSDDITLPSEALTDPDVELGVTKPKKKAVRPQKNMVTDFSSMSLNVDSPNDSQQALPQGNEALRTDELGSEGADPATPPPVKVYKKRGRKSKAELMMIRLAQGLDNEPPEPTYINKLLEEPDVLEMTPGGRPQRRAAKAAMVYLQELAAELTSSCPPPASTNQSENEQTEPDPDGTVQKKRGRRKKIDWDEDDVSQDADFVLADELLKREADDEIYEEDIDLFSEGSDPELASLKRNLARSAQGRVKFTNKGTSPNGIHNAIMLPVWKCSRTTMEYREEHHSPWEFSEWVPSTTKWTFLSDNEAIEYLPQEVKSPLFTIRREGLKEDGTFYRLNRFHCLQPHEERWDMTFFVGGPVWSMDWCPTPDGSAACQYIALYCNLGMDDKHKLSDIHVGPGLLQLWNVGPLQHESCSSTKASMAYGIALDNGCIWDLKFCPSGAWELPSTKRKNPQMPRLGLLAVAYSSGFVEIYSLPHSESLHAYKQLQVKDPFFSKYTICKVQCVATLNVGSIQASSSGECGQCFSLAWMPAKPHHHLAAGFYDGTVAMWDLTTKSLLQRVRYADGLIKLYPFNCFLAHDHAVRCIQWCKANSNFIVTAGKDRKIKFWDLRRLYEPLNSIKRFLSTEITWILPYSGVAVAQDNCYASFGLCGIHYLDTGCLGYKAYYVAPRKGTVWSISGSDWLNSIAAGDVTGEVIAAILPDLTVNPSNIKRPSERRFPVYKADLLQCSTLANPPADQHSEGEQEDGGESPQPPMVNDRSYKATVAKYSILYQDTDLRHFKQYLTREPMKRMWNSESKGDLCLDRMQLESIHKVRFSPNLDSHGWLISGGQAGLIRAHCMRGLTSHISRKLVMECQAQFSSMYENEMQDEVEYIPEVSHSILEAE